MISYTHRHTYIRVSKHHLCQQRKTKTDHYLELLPSQAQYPHIFQQQSQKSGDGPALLLDGTRNQYCLTYVLHPMYISHSPQIFHDAFALTSLQPRLCCPQPPHSSTRAATPGNFLPPDAALFHFQSWCTLYSPRLPHQLHVQLGWHPTDPALRTTSIPILFVLLGRSWCIPWHVAADDARGRGGAPDMVCGIR